jgi:hypothetical protein
MFRYKGTALDITVIPDTAAAVKQHMPAKVTIKISVADPGRHDADPDPACYFDADPDSCFQMKPKNLEKVLKQAHVPYFSLVICELMRIRIQLISLMRIRILPFSLMRVRIRNTDYNSIPYSGTAAAILYRM